MLSSSESVSPLQPMLLLLCCLKKLDNFFFHFSSGGGTGPGAATPESPGNYSGNDMFHLFFLDVVVLNRGSRKAAISSRSSVTGYEYLSFK